ncbi:MAG: FtsW/RodA/SpoVE family cell cycle protein [Sulfuritalea sp.]|nr:FtsW/RodA/SpoVE family cell cycle protein [Sulfuritalea sp.]
MKTPEMETGATLHWQRWALPVLALLLFFLGVFEYPRALEKMHRSFDGWHVVKSTLTMILAAGAGCWIGWRARWLDQLEQVQAHYWIAAAITVIVVPSFMYSSADFPLVWNTGIPGVEVDPGHLSILAFFGWIASLRTNAKRPDLQHGWNRSSVVALLGIAWAWAITHFSYNSLAVLTGLLIAIALLRGTKWFRAAIIAFGVWGFFLLIYVGTRDHLRNRLIAVLAPFHEPMGRNFVPYQARRSIGESGWFGGYSLHDLPAASHQFMLSTVGEHFGWFGLLSVILLVTLFLLLTRVLLRKLPDGWLRYFATAILGFLILSSAINVIGNLGLSSPVGLGIPFLARNWFLAAVAAFLIGVTLRNQPVAVLPAPTFDGASRSAHTPWTRLVIQTFAVLAIALLGLTVTRDIAMKAKPKPPLPLQARANILDRNDNILATNEKRLAVWLDRSKMAFTDGRKLAALGLLIGKSPKTIYGRATQSDSLSRVYLAYNLPLSMQTDLEELRFPGLNLHEMNTRVYPHGEAAAHVLGFTTADTDASGLDGVELARDRALTSRRSKDPIKPLALHLDSAIQQAAYKSLAEVSDQHDASLGAAIVVNMKGEILAMVNTPGFDPADRELLDSWHTTNHALTNDFPPGELLRPITRAAAISEGTQAVSDWWLREKLKGLGLGQRQRIDVLAGSASSGFLREEFVPRPHFDVKATLVQLTHAYLTIAGDGAPRTLRLVNDGSDGRSDKPVFNLDTVQTTRRELEAVASKYVAMPGIRTGGAAASIIAPSGSNGSDSLYAYIRLLTPRAIDVYIGLAPIDAPKYIVAVMLQRDGAQRMAGHPAATAFGRIMQAAMDCEKKSAP